MAWWVFQNVFATAILALIVVVICRTFRITPVIRHALWMLVLIKFITPPIFTWPWQVPDPLGIQALSATQESESAVAMAVDASSLIPREQASALPRATGLDPALETQAASRRETPESRTQEFAGFSIGSWLLLFWAAGAAVVLLVEGIRLMRVARAVRSGRKADPSIVERVHELAARLEMPPVAVVAMPHTKSPAMWCLGRPRLLWPAELPDDFTHACIDGLIVHELAHIKRRDHIVGWIELGASVIWWWNPLFWFVRSALREQAELACDGWVIAALPNGRRAYAESLLALSSAATADVPAPMTAVFGVRARSRRALERRLVMIMKGRASRRLPVFGLVGVGILAVATLPAWAAGTQQIPPPPPPSAPVPVVVSQPAPAPQPAVAVAPGAQAPTMKSFASTAPQTPPPPPAAPGAPPSAPPPAPPAPGYARTTVPAMAAPATTGYPAQGAVAAPTVTGRPGAVASTTVAPTTLPRAYQTTVARPVAVAVQGGRGAGTTAPAQPTTVTAVPQRPARVATVTVPARDSRVYAATTLSALPADAQTQVKSFDEERTALQAEVERKMEAKRADLIKSLQAMQDQYTKAGKLDEAIAIRDYIRTLDRTAPRVIRR